MKRLYSALLIASLLLVGSLAWAEDDEDGTASARSVNLAMIAGPSIPLGGKFRMDVSEAWGGYVNIPLISTFHLEPQVTMYRIIRPKSGYDRPRWVGGVTDITNNFKYVVPVPMWHIGFALGVGLTHGDFPGTGNTYNVHVGAQFCLGIRMVSVVDFITVTQWRVLIDEGLGNPHFIQPMAGLQFQF